MALKSTVFKAQLQIADMDRHYYADHTITLARHPSETDERMMVRLLGFALHADEQLTLGEGICKDDEADLCLKDLSGVIRLWIEVGTPDEKLLRKACGRADQVYVYSYGGRTVDIWFEQNRARLARNNNLSIVQLARDDTTALAAMARRNMQLQCTIQDGQAWMTDGDSSVLVNPTVLLSPVH